MSTLKERFEEKYKEGAFLYQNLGQPNWGGVLSFIQAELLLLAEEVESKCQPQYDEMFIRANKQAVALIRSKAAELN